jgi:membrane protein
LPSITHATCDGSREGSIPVGTLGVRGTSDDASCAPAVGGYVPGVLDRWRARWGWLDAVLRATERFGAVGGGPLSASIALAAFLSLFPLLLVGIAVVGFVSSGDTGFATDLVSELGLEGRSAQVMTDAIAAAEGSRKAASVVGVAGLLWSGLAVVGSLQNAINAVWQEKGRGLADRLVALRWLAGAVVLFLGTAVLGPIATFLPGWAAPLLVVAGLALSTVLFLWTYTTLGHNHQGWRAHLVGAVVVAVGVEVLKQVGSFYVPKAVASSSALYGSIGVIFAVLAWLALYGQLIVYGAVVNVLRWEADEGTDVIPLEVPHHEGAAPVSATRGGAVAEHAPDRPA